MYKLKADIDQDIRFVIPIEAITCLLVSLELVLLELVLVLEQVSLLLP